jgi:hypothetical protein
MWNDMGVLLKSIFPVLIILRLADSNKPTLDRLYLYVRTMDKVLEKAKVLLDELESNYNKTSSGAGNYKTKMLNYFLTTTNEKDCAEYHADFEREELSSASDDDNDDEDESVYDYNIEATDNDDSNDDSTVSTTDASQDQITLGDTGESYMGKT